MNLTWPARLQMGVMLNPIKPVKFTCDANWTNWSVQPNWKFVFDQKIQLYRFARMLGYPYSTDTQVITQDFKDTWNLSYGCEIKPDAKTTLRFGYDPRPTSVRNNLFGPLPFPDINIYSAGIGIVVDDKPKPTPKNFHERLQQLNNPNEINITVSYIKMADKTVLSNTSKNLELHDFHRHRL